MPMAFNVCVVHFLLRILCGSLHPLDIYINTHEFMHHLISMASNVATSELTRQSGNTQYNTRSIQLYWPVTIQSCKQFHEAYFLRGCKNAVLE